MSTYYAQPPQKIADLLGEVLQRHEAFAPIREADVKIDMLCARRDDGKPAVRHHGVSCAATIKVIAPEQRAAGAGDVRLVYDGATFDRNPAETTCAILAHELYHITIPREITGEVRVDAYSRPVIRLKPDDWCINGFVEVHEWYGENSIEYQNIERVGQMVRQQVFPFASETAEPTSEAKSIRSKGGKSA